MILSRGNMAVAEIARVDGIPVVLTADGATIGLARRSMLAVEPVPEEVRKQVPLADTGREEKELALSVETAAEIARAIPRDKLFGGLLEHAEVHGEDSDEVEAEVTDGKRRRTIVGKVARIPEWRGALRSVLRKSRGVGIVLNRKRLLALLSALDHACSDAESGEGAVWVEITETGVLLRSIATRTGQRAVGYMVRAEGVPELSPSEWERKIRGSPPRRVAHFG